MTNTFLKNCSVAKYQIFREEEEDCLGISNSRILLSSLSNFLRRPNKAEVMVVKAILTKRVKLTRTTLAAANPPSSQWQPPSASIITVFFQPNKKYPAASPPTTEPKSQELKVIAMSMSK